MRTTPKKLTKTTLAPPPIGWRQPFDNRRSPFRISFADNDPSRNGMKVIRVRKMDGSLAEYIVKETMADVLESRPSAQMIADCREYLGSQRVSDSEIAARLKDAAETVMDGVLHVDANAINRAPADDSATHTVLSLRLSYALTHALLLWLSRNLDTPWRLDGDADWCVSGYRLFHAGVLDQRCQLTPGTLNPTAEEVEDFPDIFISRDRMAQSELADIMEVNARHLVLCNYLDLLQEAGDHPATDAPASFAPCLAHNILFTERWLAKQMAETISHEPDEFAHVVKINTATGEIQPLLGDEAAADHLIEMGLEYIVALTEGRVKKSP